jgi:succinate-semialdehyde dehydrogenase/glutarate-semialdehyde dehydrogenase
MPDAPQTLCSFDPGTGESLGEAPICGPVEVMNAVQAAQGALGAWRGLGYDGRGQALLKLRDKLYDDHRSFAELLSRENGKPLPDALTEVLSACEFLAYYAKHAGRILKDQPISVSNPILRDAKTMLVHQPKGVVGVISPWNYPLLLSMASIASALAAGNTVVHKPSEWTPLTAMRLARLAESALPPGVFNLVTGDGSTGAALVAAPVNHVCFTGSVATGRRVAQTCAEKLITTTLELGGKDPALVMPDADLDFTARGVVWAAFSNAGQACASIERLYVPRELAEALTVKIVRRVEALTVGHGLEPGVEVGPIVSAPQLAKIAKQVEEAIAQGATALTGGGPLPGPGHYYAPTVLTGVTPDMLLMQEETFGPVLPILVVDSVEEMIAAANDSPFGLSASVWGRDLERAEAVARRLEAGTVWVNTALDTYGVPQTPRGGFKEGGIGKVGGEVGLLDMVETKLVDLNRSGRARPWWTPAGSGLSDFLEGAIAALHGRGLGVRARGLVKLLKHWPRG